MRPHILLFTLSLSLLSSLVHSKILVNESFEGINLPYAVSGTAPTLSKSYFYAGSKALKMELDYYASSPNYRSELTSISVKGSKNLEYGQIYWIGLSAYIPSDYKTATSNGDIIIQIHGDPDTDLNETYRNPAFTIAAEGSKWVTSHVGDASPVTPFTDYDVRGGRDLGRIEPGKWVRFVIQIRGDWKKNGNGFYIVYKNGVEVASYTGQLFFNDVEGPTIKAGLYRPAWKPAADAWGNPEKTDHIYQRTLYLDDLMIGDENSSVAEMTPQVLQPATARPEQDKSKLLFLGDYEVDQITVPATSGIGRPIENTFFYSGMGPNCEPRGNDPHPDNGSRLVTSPVLSGSKAMRLEVRYDCDYREFNGGLLQKPRSETKALHPNAQIKIGEEYWLGFGFYLDSDFVFDFPDNPDNLFQLVKEESDTTGSMGKNMIELSLKGDVAEMQFQHPGGLENPPVETASWLTAKGVWQQVVLHFRLCKITTINCSGFIDLYVNNNNQPIYKDTGPNTISDTHHSTVNLYKYAWHCTQLGPNYRGLGIAQSDFEFCMRNPHHTKHNAVLGPRYVTFDNFNIGRKEATIYDVMPSWGGVLLNPPPSQPPLFHVD